MDRLDEAGAGGSAPAPRDGSSRIVVIGASWGGVYALKDLVSRLPADFAASIVIVTHVGPNRSVLPKILSDSGPLRAAHALDGEHLSPGRIYVGPPDLHLLVEGTELRLSRGPKEHHTRPAIDPLFRSAALSRGSDVIGVVLTGMLDDGTAGLQVIKQCGGVAVVQDPREAIAPSMPSSALKYVDVDHCLPVAAIAERLAALTRSGPSARPSALDAIKALHEQDLFLGKGNAMTHLEAIANPSTYVCPDCTGSLWEIAASRPKRFRCHTGHAFTVRSLEKAQDQTVDVALWTALRALQEKQVLLQNMATASQAEGDSAEGSRLAGQAREVGEAADALRRLLERVPTAGQSSA